MRGILPILLVLGCTQPGPLAAQNPREVPPFRSVALSDGGEVVIRRGGVPAVEVVDGYADVSVEDGRLKIGRCRTCPRVHDRRIEVVAPALDSLSVEDGGRIIVADRFPSQAQLTVRIASGGSIDARRLDPGHATASVTQGGTILIRPADRLDASVSQGGAVTYWGDPDVSRSVRHGGVIARGREQDAERPLAELARHPLPAPPPLPPIPPLPGGDD